MARFKVAVCELPAEMTRDGEAWLRLRASVSREAPQFVLLNEMPFGPWIAAGERFDEPSWEDSCAAHERGITRFDELGAPYIASSRPGRSGASRVNEAFIWTKGTLEAVHTKQFFPDEEGYYEARWFQAGARDFRIASAGPLRCGFLICTEVMFNERARRYGRDGAQVILVPRATGTSLDRWLVALRMAAIVSGCYVLSSNRAGRSSRGQTFGGSGWVIDPTGNVVVQTSAASPVAFAEIDTDLVTQAQTDYPCYVKE